MFGFYSLLEGFEPVCSLDKLSCFTGDGPEVKDPP
jgi:hypothetical protein